ncbi:MAG: DEAD/DEAH box helicase [Bdellovibrionales bacterium GWB1_55_8]|nr:MAG: DEAD/DEAH box helicase [Bdellovibrionales bacterium GWB1_55_8]
MKTISIPITEFAVPVPRIGSIESLSGYGRSAAEGQEIHREVQARRAKKTPGYQPEFAIAREFEREGYLFRISGRMDGFFSPDSPGARPKIEEIKTAFNASELVKRVTAPRALSEHPYCLQLRTYGYFYWLNEGVVPDLWFYLASTRRNESESLEIELDLKGYEEWLERRFEEVVEEARHCERRAKKRRKIAETFQFPFSDPRPCQKELIGAIEEGVSEQKRMLIQAPTGLGKTVGVLYPVLKESLSRAQKTVYVTPKNSQHAVAEDAVLKFQITGAKVRSLTITAKSKICFKNEPLCNPEYCEFARDYYTKVHARGLRELLAKKRRLRARTFREMGEEYQVCPFELQLDAAQDVEVVICDYNYVFAPRTAFGRMTASALGQIGKPSLVIDEAHNLPARTMDYYSPGISTAVLERLRQGIRELPNRFSEPAEELLDECIQRVIACRPVEASGSEKRSVEIAAPVESFFDQDARLRSFLSQYLASDIEIRPKDVVLRLSFYWSEFTAALEYAADEERTEFFTTYHPHPTGGIVKITCCDASEMLRDCYDEYDQVIGFSATLKPFEYYAKLSGLVPEEIRTEEFSSPFPPGNRKLLIIPQVSTKYSDRERNYGKVAEVISRVAVLRPGNYFAFFPSFEFMERVLGVFDAPPGFTVFRQERDMRVPAVEAVLDHLRACAEPTILFAVQGGVFSEGVDYPGEMMIGAFVVGPPLPNFDLEREKMREFYQENYGSGFEYAYTYPAMAKAVQAAGRVIRSEKDRGVIVLMDGRFVQPSYTKSMPSDWFATHARELVSTSILKEVSDFWKCPTSPVFDSKGQPPS